MHPVLPARKPPPGQRHQAGLQAAQIESVAECQAHVPRAVQIGRDKRRVHEPIVLCERGSGLEILEDCARRVDPRLDRVMNPLERRHIHESGGIAEQHDALTGTARGQRVEPALGNGLRAPLDHLSAREQ